MISEDTKVDEEDEDTTIDEQTTTMTYLTKKMKIRRLMNRRRR